MLIVPVVFLSHVTRPPTTGIVESQRAKSHIEIFLLFPYSFREYLAYKVWAKATHTLHSHTILRKTIILSKSLIIFTSLCM